MSEFSTQSLERLSHVHNDLQLVFMEVVQHFDCTILSGMRTQEEQQELYAQGRTTEGMIVTYKDGIVKRSKHQTGDAVDVIPYPINWSDKQRMREFGWFVKGVSEMMYKYGTIENKIIWGGDWQWADLPHFEI